jgi:hypothetical protein
MLRPRIGIRIEAQQYEASAVQRLGSPGPDWIG